MATVYISPTGNDSTGTGTQGNPWQTISKAFTSSNANDTIFCLAGTFPWATGLTTFASPRTLTATIGTAAFDNTGTAPTWQFTANWTISNLTFQGTGTPNTGSYFLVRSTSTLTMTNCTFTALLMATGQSAAAQCIIGNTVANETETVVVTACLFKDSSNGGGGATAGEIFGAAGTSAASILTVTVTNCTFYSNHADTDTMSIVGGNSGSGTCTVTLTNNIFWNANGTNKAWTNAGGGLTATYSGSNNDILGYSGTPSLGSQLSTDPLFVDAANANFNLRPTSPCIGAGTMI